MVIIPLQHELADIVKQAQNGQLCLPNFQRDFVWKREAIADLLRSILRGYYIGSLLLLENRSTSPLFGMSFFRGAAPTIVTPNPTALVLDGQQRLTSLLYALTAPQLPLRDSKTPRRYFIDVSLILGEYEDAPEDFELNLDDDGCVFDLPSNKLEGLDQEDEQHRRGIIPCTAMTATGEGSFSKWLSAHRKWLKVNVSENASELFENKCEEKLRRQFDRFVTFSIPLNELRQQNETKEEFAGRVCAIFEKLNSTGEELSTYDLLTARLHPAGIDLHRLWKTACEGENTHSGISALHKRLNEWSKGDASTDKWGVLTLKTVALMRDRDTKPKTLINLNSTNFEDDWRKAVDAIEIALKQIELVNADGFGVFERKWMPGLGPLPALATLRAAIKQNSLGASHREDLRVWYWCSVFLERYSSSTDTILRRDTTEILGRWGLLPDARSSTPEVFVTAKARIGAPGFSIRGATTYSSAIYSGVFCLLALEGARDWKREESIELQKLQDHHIFPQAYLKRHGITDRDAINTVLNRTLISDQTNNLIKDKAPAIYLTNVNLFDQATLPQLLSSHFINDEAHKLLGLAAEGLTDQEVRELYEQFLQVREKTILERVRTACRI